MRPTNGRSGNDQGDPIISPRATENKLWVEMLESRTRKENSTALAADARRDGDLETALSDRVLARVCS